MREGVTYRRPPSEGLLKTILANQHSNCLIVVVYSLGARSPASHRDSYRVFLPAMTAAQPSQATLLGRWLFLNLLRLLGAVAIGWAIGVQVSLLLS
jgi:hypothetical protein